MQAQCPNQRSLFLKGKDEYTSCEDEEGEEKQRLYPLEGELMMIKRSFNNQSSATIETQRENIFHTRCKILENICSLIVDSGSSCNCCSTRLVEKLNLQVVLHPKIYKLQWINDDGELIVDKQVKVKFSIGNYQDNVLCDVVPMEACHILLGRPWHFDKKTLHNGLTNEITFTHQEKNFILYPLSPSQVIEDEVQMKKKEEEKITKIEKDIQHEENIQKTIENMILVEQPSILVKGT